MKFAPRFEGREALDGLLELAGSPHDAEAVVARFREAVARGEARSEVIPSLFEGEPRFPEPSLAQRLYQNLFGLWELVESGEPVRLEQPVKRVREKKAAPPPPPPPFGKAPDRAWVESAWRYLEALDPKGIQRLQDGFENRQDALLSFLDASGLSDEGYALARHLLFELSAMIELGWPPGLRSVSEKELEGPARIQVPEALSAYAEEARFEEEAGESERVKQIVEQALAALWGARKGTR